MTPKTKATLAAFALLLCGSGGWFLLRPPTPSGAAEPVYQSAGSAIKPKYKQFTDLKCLAAENTDGIERVDILQEENHVNPKGVRYRTVFVVITTVNREGTFYTFQAIDYRKGGCDAYYSTVGDEEESNPASRVFGAFSKALEVQLLWDKWRLANIPNWKQKTQKYLNGPKVQLAKEEYLSLKQLGFKMPQKWEEIK